MPAITDVAIDVSYYDTFALRSPKIQQKTHFFLPIPIKTTNVSAISHEKSGNSNLVAQLFSIRSRSSLLQPATNQVGWATDIRRFPLLQNGRLGKTRGSAGHDWKAWYYRRKSGRGHSRQGGGATSAFSTSSFRLFQLVGGLVA